MKITKKSDNNILTIAVEGRIDSTTAPELEATVSNDIKECTGLVFDFENLDYISSAGLRILLGAKKLMGERGMKVINVNNTVYEIFEITGFSYVLDVEKL